ncbi:MAG: UDP-N-acetylmuramoyl-L-alanine--D-glutamate ligase [Bacillota bacterium]|nr:UDP-N-acetylmuramoyl-L-alanine--D-glutamate ligase [Bacillota bacterium]
MNNELKNKKILVVGMGRSGIAAMETALSLGAEVSVQDNKSLEEIGLQLRKTLEGNPVKPWLGCVPEDMGAYDMMILSPGVPTDLPMVEEARAAGVEIIGELELAYRLCKGNFIGITGTNGKTTTTTLVGEIYKAAGRETYVVGNIGVAVLSGAREASVDGWLVTEISSFQLETTEEFRPEVSAILNLTPDHLNRHKTMENYGKAKARIFLRQSRDQYCVINADDPECFALTEGCPATVVPFSRRKELAFGAFVRDGVIMIRDQEGREISFCRADELKIPGSHNLENALAATAIAHFGGIGRETITETLRTFAGVAHRIELVRQIGGVRFVNDSKGTNTDAAIKAIEAMKENIILIAGGYDKKADFTPLIEAFDGRVKKAILMGETAPIIQKTAEKMGFTETEICSGLEECVVRAWESASPGDVVLLSPACASWDMYDNFEQRGEHFRTCAERLPYQAVTI